MSELFKKIWYSIFLYKIVIFVLLCILSSFSQEVGQSDGPYTVCGKITGYKHGCQINIAIFSNQGDYKKRKYTKANRFVSEKTMDDTVSYCFHGLKEGEYLIVAYQDLNGDQKVNTNFLGIPTEPYQFYKPVGPFKFPTFSNCKFELKNDFSGADLYFEKR
jgi:uncharacterized protein (DUF2141 family)